MHGSECKGQPQLLHIVLYVYSHVAIVHTNRQTYADVLFVSSSLNSLLSHLHVQINVSSMYIQIVH